MRIHLIRADGTQEHVEAAYSAIRGLIGAEVMDAVNLRDGRVMLIDDFGYETEMVKLRPGHFQMKPTKARKQVNAEATRLYHAICIPGTTRQIVGDVAIVYDADVD